MIGSDTLVLSEILHAKPDRADVQWKTRLCLHTTRSRLRGLQAQKMLAKVLRWLCGDCKCT